MDRLKIFGSWFPWAQMPLAEGSPPASFELDEVAYYSFAQLMGLYAGKPVLVGIMSDGSIRVTESRTSNMAYNWTSPPIIPGGNAIFSVPNGKLNSQCLASVTVAQPVVVYLSFDGGATYSTNPSVSITNLILATAISNVCTNMKFVNNAGAGNAVVQLVGLYTA